MTILTLNSDNPWKSGFAGTVRCLVESGQHGLKTFVAAPFIVALAVVPEAAQHIAEVKLGMFDSKEAFRALANDPTRWAFGYAKVAGLVAAMLLTARFWALGSVRKALLLGTSEFARLVVAIALLIGSAEALTWLADRSGSALLSGLLTGVNWLGQAVLLVVVAGALLGDSKGWRSRLLQRLPTALLLVVLAAVLFAPLQGLHMANHLAALAQPAWIVWPVLLFDSLLVGLMATVVGASLAVGYRAGPTWTGWTSNPRRAR